MKSFSLSIVVLLTFTFFCTSVSAQTYKRYNNKSGIIEYEIDGTYEGTATLYWDDYGMKEALYTDKEITKFGIRISGENTVEIIDGDSTFKIDLDDLEGEKSKNDYADTYGSVRDANDILEISKLAFTTLGGKIEEKRTKVQCGKKCEIWTIEAPYKGKYHVWEGIFLTSEEEITKGIEMIKKCKSIKLDVPIPAEKLAVPTNIEFEED